MGTARYNRRIRAGARIGIVSTLITAITFAPLPGMISEARATQLGAAGAAGGLAGQGAMLSQLMAMLSMASGAMGMQKGAQQSQCCAQGCTGAGAQQTGEKAAIDAASQGAANSIPKSPRINFRPGSKPAHPTDLLRLKKLEPTPASTVPNCVATNNKALLLWNLMHPAKADAMGGCADAMLAMAMGAAQMLAGLLSMLASQKQKQNQATNQQTGQDLGTISDPKKLKTVSSTGLGDGATGSSEVVKIDPALLREGTANSILTNFENTFGIGRDQFAEGLANGVDPREMLANAPKNALSKDDMNKAFSAANSLSADQKAAALAANGVSEMSAEAAAELQKGANSDEFAMATGGGTRPKIKAATPLTLDDLNLDGDKAADAATMAELSPEIQQALANREKERMLSGLTEETIFQVVHRKYREKMNVIYGPHGRNVGGVADANGN